MILNSSPTIQPLDNLYNPSGLFISNEFFTGSSNNQLFGNPSTAVVKNNNIPATISTDGTVVNFTGYFQGIVMIFISASEATSVPNAFTYAYTAPTSVAADDQVVNSTAYTTKGSCFLNILSGSFGLTDLLASSSAVPSQTKVYFMPFLN